MEISEIKSAADLSKYMDEYIHCDRAMSWEETEALERICNELGASRYILRMHIDIFSRKQDKQNDM